MAKALKIAVAYRGIPHAKGWATGDNLARAFRELGHEVYAYGNYYGRTQRLNRQALPDELDLLVYCECNDDNPQYLELRYQKARARVYWDFDVDNGRLNITSHLIKRVGFDIVFHANKRYDKIFGKLAPKTVFMPYAFDHKHFHPMRVKKSIDVAIIGSAYPQRQVYVKRLAKYGVSVEFINGVYQQDYAKAINRLKIHLNLNIYGPGGDGLLVGRVWETLGCGTFLLTQRKDFIEDFFEDGVHLALFDNEKDCADKIKYYLEHESDRLKVAHAGYEKALKHHTYLARAQTILSETQALLGRPARNNPSTIKEKLGVVARKVIPG